MMISDTIQVLSTSTTAIPAGLFLVVIFALLPRFIELYGLSSIPLVGGELGGDSKRRQAYTFRARDLYADGYKKFKDGVFRLTTLSSCRTVVVGPRFLDELKRLPDDVLSVNEAFKDSMESEYLGMKIGLEILPHTIRADLTPSLTRVIERLNPEVDRAFETEMPDCKNWTKVNINQKLFRMVAKLSGCVFIGSDLAYSETYLDAAINYTIEIMSCQQAVKAIHPWLKPFLAPRLPELRSLNKRLEDFVEFIKPEIAARRDPKYVNSSEKKDDALQWFLDKAKEHNMDTDEEMAKLQLNLSFAAIHTTTLTATNVFYDLAAMPEYIQPLRQEIKDVMAEHGGIITQKGLQSMRKLDSFLKESQRVSPPSVVGFRRRLLKDITLSNGQRIPGGVMLEVCANEIHHDKDIFPNSDKFDGFRYYNLHENRVKDGSERHQFVSVNQQSLNFGFGRHACPGRFFAASEIKMVIAKTLLNYDMKTTDGADKRYPNVEFGIMALPDPQRELLFREAVV